MEKKKLTKKALEKFLKDGKWKKVSEYELLKLESIRLAEKMSKAKNIDLTF